ncbi:MAG: response regulator [Bacteroidetes bacterium]|nr:response regulator [Bacteroidota bacterium]MBS1740019.1 response regulator [Bacteroidota bacterium]MBS1777665.1 response regulator [Bacteroidota bacterium]
MHKVILIDDEPLARQLIRKLLLPYEDLFVVAECGDGFEGFKSIQQHKPDLVFVDVQMPRVNGFEMLELLECPPQVIFTTAFDEYALKAFDAHAVDYLLKPITKERLDKAITKWQKSEQKSNTTLVQNLLAESPVAGYQHRLVVKDSSTIRIIPTTEINYVEASDDYVKIHTNERHFLKKDTLSHIEQVLDPKQFVRAHRSYLLPVAQLLRIEPYEKDSHVAILHCGARIPVSKAGMTRLKEVLGL